MACKSWAAILVVMLGFVPYSIDMLPFFQRPGCNMPSSTKQLLLKSQFMFSMTGQTVKKKACNAHQIWCATFVPTGTPYMA